MSFALGMFCGLAIGACITALAYTWMDGFADPDSGPPWLGRKCPPCDGQCRQGRDCPSHNKVLFTDDIHTCHDDCQKPACVQARRARGQA